MHCYVALILKMWANLPNITYAKIPIAICPYRIVKALKIAAIRIIFFFKP